MQVYFGSYSKCLKNFTPVKIVQKYKDGEEATHYLLLDKHRGFIGQFDMANDGFICNLKLDKAIRRKRLAANAIISVKNFVIEKAKEKGIDVVFFLSDKSKPSLKKMYTALGAECIGEQENAYLYDAFIKRGKSDHSDIEIEKMIEKMGIIIKKINPFVEVKKHNSDFIV